MSGSCARTALSAAVRYEVTIVRSATPYRRRARTSAASWPQRLSSTSSPTAGVELEHVELDQVDSELDRAPQRAKGVLGLERRRAAVADAQDPAAAPSQL